jgi:hypothetical protein
MESAAVEALELGTVRMAGLGARHALLMTMASGEATVRVMPSMTAVLSMTEAACGWVADEAICTEFVAATEAPTVKGD